MKKPDKKKYKNEVHLPEGFEIPTTGTDDKTFEAVAEIRKESDGRYCVVALDGIPLDEEKDDGDMDGGDEPLGTSAKAAMNGGYA